MAVTGGIMGGLSAAATDRNILGGIIAGAVGGLICACSLAIAGPLLTKGFVGAALFSTLGGGFAAGVARYGINQLANGNEFNGWEAFGYGAIGALINLVAIPFSFVAGGLSTVWEQILMDSLLTSI